MKHNVRRCLAIALTCIALGINVSVFGTEQSDSEEAKRLFKEGNALFVEKDYESAIERFSESLELFPTYNGYFNLANSYRALRRYSDALDTVTQMREDLGPSSKHAVNRQFDDFVQEIYAIVGFLRVRATPDGATVVVDGKEVGRTPIKDEIILGPGFHEVVVRKVGFDSRTVHTEVHSEQHNAIDVALNRAAGELFLTVDAVGALVTLDNEPMGKTPLNEPLWLTPGPHRLIVSKPGFLSEDQEVNVVPGDKMALTVTLQPEVPLFSTEPSKRSRRTPLFWGMLAGTAVSAVVGGSLWGVAAGKAGELHEKNEAYLAAKDDGLVSMYDKNRRDARRVGRGVEKAAIGMTVVTGGLAVAFGIIVILESRQDTPETETEAPDVAWGPGSIGVRF